MGKAAVCGHKSPAAGLINSAEGTRPQGAGRLTLCQESLWAQARVHPCADGATPAQALEAPGDLVTHSGPKDSRLLWESPRPSNCLSNEKGCRAPWAGASPAGHSGPAWDGQREAALVGIPSSCFKTQV